MKNVFLNCGANKGFIIERFIEARGDDWEIHAFECLPECVGILNNKFGNNKKVIVQDCAVSTYDGSATFRLGSSTNSGSLREDKTTYMTGQNLLVRTVDFSSWVRNNVTEEDKVCLAMDIEGGEYDILKKMIKDNTLSFIDTFYLEFHGQRCLQGFDMSIEKNIKSALDNAFGDKIIYNNSSTWSF
jgi:FkbM family methyltransferase